MHDLCDGTLARVHTPLAPPPPLHHQAATCATHHSRCLVAGASKAKKPVKSEDEKKPVREKKEYELPGQTRDTPPDVRSHIRAWQASSEPTLTAVDGLCALLCTSLCSAVLHRLSCKRAGIPHPHKPAVWLRTAQQACCVRHSQPSVHMR